MILDTIYLAAKLSTISKEEQKMRRVIIDKKQKQIYRLKADLDSINKISNALKAHQCLKKSIELEASYKQNSA
jgi:uncharacterized membrane protein